MLIVIIGGSGSGKSGYAEDVAVSLGKGKNKYYLATMEVFGEEGKKRVEKHRKAREGKGFLTLEQKRDISGIADKIDGAGSLCLLECMSNLVANEMFQGEKVIPEEQVIEKVLTDVDKLHSQTGHLLIVSNNVFEDGMVYDTVTTGYNRALGKINQEISKKADAVIEVVVGIPVALKGGLPI